MNSFLRHFFLVLFSIAVFSCSAYDRDPDLRLARDFIDAYYVMADQQAALKLATGRAEEELKKEAALLRDVPGRQDSYRSRDIVFELKRSDKSESEVSYFYELKVIQPELGETIQMVHLIVDRKSSKIKDFRSLK